MRHKKRAARLPVFYVSTAVLLQIIMSNADDRRIFYMKEIKGSRTYDNLMMAFAGETQARTKYSIFASKAKEEGYHQIGRIFEETADNEKEHAEIWFRHLAGLGNTAENLVSAAEGEHYEWSSMYADMAKTAREEGFTEIAKQMEQIADIEKHHEDRYNKLLENIRNGEVFRRSEERIWICGNCGHQVTAAEAPEICPVCHHQQGYFSIKAENY